LACFDCLLPPESEKADQGLCDGVEQEEDPCRVSKLPLVTVASMPEEGLVFSESALVFVLSCRSKRNPTPIRSFGAHFQQIIYNKNPS